ncbi:hypothetical protein NL478_27235, partial [Klebsiella pneumoniae]|nr:hypothetical protein [Klebsiella pneumoniae]
WVLRNGTERKQMVASPEPPIKFQYSKIRRKSSENVKRANNTEFISGKSDTLFQKIVLHEDSLKQCGFTSLADIRTIKSVEHLNE